MTREKLIKKLCLDDAALESIKKAVQEEETKSTGEIVVAVAPESDSYSFYELVAATVTGAVLFAILLALSGQINGLLDRLMWQVPVWLYPLICGCAFLISLPLVFALVNIQAIDRIIIPHHVKAGTAWKRALRCFAESGVYKTREQTGILIFVSYLERSVHILADSGIAAKIEQSQWDGIATELAAGLTDGHAAEAFCGAVHSCGALLAQHFPPHPGDNPDELADGLIILED